MKKITLLSLVLGFAFFTSQDTWAQTTTSGSKEEVFTIVEKMPEFPGGEDGLIKYINNTPYPKEAIAQGIEGKVYLNFLIDSLGNVKEVQVTRSLHKLLDDEAVRMVKMMPRWSPGTQGGKPVTVSFNLPVSFNLGNKRKK